MTQIDKQVETEVVKKSKPKSLFAPASPKQALMLQRAADTQILVIGGAAGSGKSYLLQLIPLMLVDDPKSNCIMFRRTNPQIKGAGGIFETGTGIYNNLPKRIRPKVKTGDLEVIFPRYDEDNNKFYDGAKIKYQQAENVEQSKLNVQGLQYTFIGVDEGTQFEWEQLEYFMSRLRSQSKHFSRMVISCNPDPDHELKKMIQWYLDEEGYPIPERDGVQRFFVQDSGEYIWGNSREELAEKLNIPEERWEGKILSFSFVSGTIYDNPPMMEQNESYLAFLEGLNEVDKAQLLYGNWEARPKGASYWEREWVSSRKVPYVPKGCKHVRAWDLAATERSQANKYPDPSACIGMARDKQGYYYIYGDYHKDTYDDMYEIFGQFCMRSGSRDKQIVKQAGHDGDDTLIVLPVDPGAAGKTAYEQMAKYIISEGFKVTKDPTPTNKSKLTRFEPFATACENGLVNIVWDSFDPVTRDFIFKQLEAFDGERSTSSRKDDFADAFASAFNTLASKRVRGKFSGKTQGASTNYNKFKKRVGR
ncbi:putative terminase large subunit [Vibrio phage RYC]|nr:putative terminase large subunit [Vibrio phage RYC]